MGSFQNQGLATSKVFAGHGNSTAAHQLYGQSATHIASLLHEHLPMRDEPYVLVDIGSYKGELWQEIVHLLPEHTFHVIAIDINEAALADNPAHEKLVANVTHLPLMDRSADVVICRYVLQWNTPAQQQLILREIGRIVRRVGILQHAGSNPYDINHRLHIEAVMDGRIAALHRTDCYYSTKAEIETWMRTLDLTFSMCADRRINNLSDSFIERYVLDDDMVRAMKEGFGAYDYIMQTTWAIAPPEWLQRCK